MHPDRHTQKIHTQKTRTANTPPIKNIAKRTQQDIPIKKTPTANNTYSNAPNSKTPPQLTHLHLQRSASCSLNTGFLIQLLLFRLQPPALSLVQAPYWAIHRLAGRGSTSRGDRLCNRTWKGAHTPALHAGRAKKGREGEGISLCG